MSARLMGEVFELDVGHAEQSILLALTDHADDQGMNIYPSIGRIAWKTGYSKRQVQRIMEALRKKGVLRVVRSGSAQEHRATTYQVDLTEIPHKKPFGATPIDKMSLASPRHQASDTGTTRANDTGDTRLVTPVSPESSRESPKEPSLGVRSTHTHTVRRRAQSAPQEVTKAEDVLARVREVGHVAALTPGQRRAIDESDFTAEQVAEGWAAALNGTWAKWKDRDPVFRYVLADLPEYFAKQTARSRRSSKLDVFNDRKAS